jgi:nitroimidazol reductase NimA-like FMN-containing flavoprotein (pyridoxamine 5'-phosphate oxidase superfamily)
MYAYQQGELLDLHTGPHQGHFLATVRENQRISIEVDEPGALERGRLRLAIRRWLTRA